MRLPNTAAQLFWTHRDANDALDYDLRSRRMSPSGVVGPIDYTSIDSDVVVADLRAAVAPSGKGLVLFTELHSPISEVLHLLFQ